MGCCYRDGVHGYPQDCTKALELWHRAGELGDAKAYANIGSAYYSGGGVEVDKEKAKHYYELAAMRGEATARHNLGSLEYNLGIKEDDAANIHRALKHYMIAARSGHSKSLEAVKDMYSNGDATKEDYTKGLHSYQAYLGEIKSTQRDKAAAAREDYCYY